MTIDYHIIIGERLCLPRQRLAQKIIHECFTEVNEIYNKWNPDSELSRLNRLPPHEKAPLSSKLAHLLTLTDEAYQMSQGRFDPTVEPLLTLWKEAPPKTFPPIGWSMIHFEEGYFWKDDACVLDLSGIAKGYAIDLILERLQAELHLSNLFVEWGGEIRAAGKHPEGRSWTIFISRFGDPNPQKALDTLPLNDQAIATSGDYLQNWTLDGVTYCHIIDPHTQKPLIRHPHAVSSSSVTAPTCAQADALATAAMVFPTLEEAQEWANLMEKKYPEIRFFLARNTGTTHPSS